MSYSKEQWKAIPGYESLYEISSSGRIRSLTGRGRWAAGRILKPAPNSISQHCSVSLYKDAKRARRYVHRLVLGAFAGPCPTDKEVHHVDHNPLNNCLINLRYVTRQENQQLCSDETDRRMGERTGNAKITDEQARQIIHLLTDGQMKQKDIASQFGLSPAAMTRFASGEGWRHLSRSGRPDLRKNRKQLSNTTAASIRELAKPDHSNWTELGKQFNVTRQTVRLIATGNTYRNVT